MKIHLIAAGIVLGGIAIPVAGQISTTTPWLRETPPTSQVGAGYGVLVNKGRMADRLLSGATPVADRVEIHRMSMEGGVMRMRPVEGGLSVPAGASVTLKPGSYHLMLMGLKRPLKRGETIPIRLRFARAGDVALRFKVEAIDYQPQGGDHAGQ